MFRGRPAERPTPQSPAVLPNHHANQLVYFKSLSQGLAEQDQLFDRMGAGVSQQSSSSDYSVPDSADADRSDNSRGRSRSETSNEPSKERRGFENLGNTCFLSALLEAFSALPEFVRSLDMITDEAVRYYNSEEVDRKTHYQCRLILELHSLLCSIRREDIAPSSHTFYKYVGKLNPLLGGKRQQDAHELYLMIMESLECICKKLDDKAKSIRRFTSPLFETTCFYFCTRRRIKCSECPNESISKEPSVDVSVDLPEGASCHWNPWKSWCGNLEFNGKNQYKCDKCSKKVDAIQYTEMMVPPLVLVAHYHVFQVAEVDGNIHLQKRSKVPFPPEDIRLDDFNIGTKTLVDKRDYILCSMVIHIGADMHYGHYVAAKRIRANEWVVYDDEATVSITTEQLMSNSQHYTPYLMFYRRQSGPPSRRNAAGREWLGPAEGKEPSDETWDSVKLGPNIIGDITNPVEYGKGIVPQQLDVSLAGRWQKIVVNYVQEWLNFVFGLKFSKSLFFKNNNDEGSFNGFDDIM